MYATSQRYKGEVCIQKGTEISVPAWKEGSEGGGNGAMSWE